MCANIDQFFLRPKRGQYMRYQNFNKFSPATEYAVSIEANYRQKLEKCNNFKVLKYYL